LWIKTLRLADFRNYGRLELELDKGINFFTGPNGSGKTSILEAASYLAVARSLRGANDGEVIRWGSAEFGVGGDIFSQGSTRTATLRFSRSGGKEATLDGERLTKLSDILGALRVAWFCPEDTWLTKGGPAERRRLLDMTLCQLAPAYLEALSGYRRALRQRNEALASWAPDEESERVVEVWTDRLVDYGSRVIAGRLELLPRLTSAVAGFHASVAGSDDLRLRYRSAMLPEPKSAADVVSPEQEIRELYARALREAADDERRRGFTLVGPHRDDLEVRLGDRVLRTFGSQGQHRTAAIALKLGEAAVLDEDGQGVVVLLDDIMSELDEERGGSLIELVEGLGQALMTSTREWPLSGNRPNSASFAVEKGRVFRH